MSFDSNSGEPNIPQAGLRRSFSKLNLENDPPPAMPNTGLRRTVSRNNLHSASTMDLKSMLGHSASPDSGADPSARQISPPASSGGLRKTRSQLSIGGRKGSDFGSNVNLAKLAQSSASGKSSSSGSSGGGGGLGLRRTGSKMSLSEAIQNPQHAANIPALETPPMPASPPILDASPMLETPPKSQTAPGLGTPSLGTPNSISRANLYRSESMSSLPHPSVSEGTKAVQSITGKVHLPQAAIQSSPVGTESPTKSATTTKNEGNDVPTSGTQPSAAQGPSVHSVLPHGSIPHDDAAARPEAEDRVDYFTHKWDVSDIADSWRYVVSRRQDMANSARLENASWRMWAKAKNNLRTIDPAQVNWLKDYDVTWLYGPLYHDSEPMSPGVLPRNASITNAGLSGQASPNIIPHKTSSPTHGMHNIHGEASTVSPASRFGSLYSPPVGTTASPRATIYEASRNSNYRPKSILKKKTLAQIMLAEAQELDQITHSRRPSARQAATNYLRHHNYRPSPQGYNRQVMATILNRQYQLNRASEPSSPSTPNFGDGGLDGPSPMSSNRGSVCDSNTLAPPTSANAMSSPSSSDHSPEKTFSSGSLANSRANSWTSSHASSRASSQVGFLTHHNSVHSFRDSLSERRVHFNDRVEQCIALDPEDVADNTEKPNEAKAAVEAVKQQRNLLGSTYYTKSYMSSEDDDDDDDDDEDDSDDGGGLFLGLRRPSVLDANSGTTHTIAALPATTLNYRSEDSEGESESDDEVDSVSVPPSRRPGFNAQYKPHPVQTYQIVDPEVHPVAFEAKTEGIN